MSLALSIVGSLLLVAANGFFVATEFAIVRIRRTQVDELVEQGRAGARSLRHAVEHLDAYLAACQVGITLASIALGIVGEPAFSQVIEPLTGDLSAGASHAISFGFSLAIVTLLHVVFGELAPKSLAIARNVRTALWVAPVMRLFYLVAKPFVESFNWLGNLVLRPFGIPPAREVGHASHSERELRDLLRQSYGEGLIEQSDVDFTEGVFTFGDREAADIMVPRPEIVAIPVDMDPAECLEFVLDSPHTRHPVYRGSLDDVVGLLYLRDIVAAATREGIETVRIEELVRPAHVVPETKDLAPLLAEFRRTNQHMAIVVDEYGGTQGIVTLEDLLEEIVGDIEDEYDLPDESVERVDERTVRVDGTFPIDDFNEQFAQSLPQEDYHTVSGFVFGELGRAPELGDEVQWDGLRFEVLEVEGARIDRLEIEFPPEAGEAVAARES